MSLSNAAKYFNVSRQPETVAFLIEAHRIEAVEQQVSRVDDILPRHAHDQIGGGVAGMEFQYCGEPAQVNRKRKLVGIERMIRQAQHAGLDVSKYSGHRIQVALGVSTLEI